MAEALEPDRAPRGVALSTIFACCMPQSPHPEKGSMGLVPASRVVVRRENCCATCQVPGV